MSDMMLMLKEKSLNVKQLGEENIKTISEKGNHYFKIMHPKMHDYLNSVI